MFAPSLASAATLTNQNPANIFGSNGSASVHILSPRDIWTHAGGFALNGDISGDSAAESFTAWCLDIYAYISDGQNYNITTSPFSVAPLTQARIDNIRALFNTGLSGLNLGIGSNSAGFQLALWELVYEKTVNPLNAGAGKFRASNSTGAINTANLLLAGLAGPITGNFKLTFLESVGRRSQNLVTGNSIPVEIPSVPVPAAGLLLFSALAGTGLLARRKRRSAR